MLWSVRMCKKLFVLCTHTHIHTHTYTHTHTDRQTHTHTHTQIYLSKDIIEKKISIVYNIMRKFRIKIPQGNKIL